MIFFLFIKHLFFLQIDNHLLAGDVKNFSGFDYNWFRFRIGYNWSKMVVVIGGIENFTTVHYQYRRNHVL